MTTANLSDALTVRVKLIDADFFNHLTAILASLIIKGILALIFPKEDY